ncbi:MAG: DUF3810 family protein [Clostridia bacterium]|nr:DUF3810 family protein [Clostridia bacterium]
MEFLSKGGMWIIAAFVFFTALLKGPRRAFFHILSYFALCMLLWFSLFFYKPYGVTYEYEDKDLIELCEHLIFSTNENYTFKRNAYEIAEQSTIVMQTEGAKTIVFSYPELLDRLNLSGIFIPFNGRAYINRNEQSILLPFVAAHELSHREGILDEGQANIHAFLKCISSEEKTFRYSAGMYALKYALEEIKIRNEMEHLRLVSLISAHVMEDLEKICFLPESTHSPFRNYADLIPGLIYYQSITSQGVI